MDSKTVSFSSGKTGIVLLFLFDAAIIAAQARGTGYPVYAGAIVTDRTVAVVDIAPAIDTLSSIEAMQPVITALVDDSIEIGLNMHTRQLTVVKRSNHSPPE
jgi:hypothetical protein